MTIFCNSLFIINSKLKIELRWQVGSGSDQEPSGLQVAELEPISVKPGSHANVAIDPAIGRFNVFVDVAPVTVPLVKVAIATQVAKRRKCLAFVLKYIR